jgi:hypothetical protein
MLSMSKLSLGAPTPTMVRKLELNGELMPFMREFVEVTISNPDRFGVCGHKVNALLPTLTKSGYDYNKLVLQPVCPPRPKEPTIESVTLIYQASLPPVLPPSAPPKENKKPVTRG